MVLIHKRRPGLSFIVIVAAMMAITARAQNAAPVRSVDPSSAAPRATTLPIASEIVSLTGLTVAKVELRGVLVDPPVLAQLRDLLLPLQRAPLDRQRVAAGLRSLYATGRFADVQVEAQKTASGQVDLVFIGTENLFIGAVTVDGAPNRPSGAQLIDASKLELGALYAPEKVEEAIAHMKASLADNGYYRAQVTAKEDRNPRIQRVQIAFTVNPGAPAVIGAIHITGDSGMKESDVLKVAKLHPGQTASIQRLTSAVQRLRKRFTKRDRLEAQISLAQKEYHPDSNQVDYTLLVNRGPIVDIRVEGARLSQGKLKNFVPVYEEHAVDEDLLNEGRRNLRDYMQNQGYFDVKVDFDRKNDNEKDRELVVYDVDKGERHSLVSRVIEGNHYFDTALIKERMSVQPTGWLLPHGKFSTEMLDRDVANIKDLYLANGFLKVKVSGEFQDNYRGKTGDIAVFLHIDEGPQTLVSAVSIDGNRAIPDETLLPLLTASEGQPYSQANALTDRDTVLNYYFNHGFPDAIFRADATPVDGQADRMRVVYTIDEGPQVFVDRVLLSGLDFTKRGIVLRQFAIHAGDPLSQSAMLDTQRKLYDLGVFNAVDMAVQNPDGTARFKDVYFQFEEAKRWTFNYGIGLEVQPGIGGASTNPQGKTDVSPRVSFDVTRINVGGRAHTLSFKSNLGRLQQRGAITYDAPRLLRNPNLRLTFSLFYDNSLDVRTFTSERAEAGIQLEQVISRTTSDIPITSLLYRFNYRRVRATDIVVSPDLIPLYSRPVRVGMPSLTYIRDRRDDPIESHKGSYNTFDAGVASGAFGSEAAFGRFNGQNTTYHEFHAKRWVFARNTRIGVAEPFGATTQLPLPERFFAGGATSHRGFGINQAGPRDLVTGQPLGGNAVLINSEELRMPPVVLPFIGDNMSFVLFHDMGNVFSTVPTMFHSLVRFDQPHRELCTQESTAPQCRFDYMSQAVGMGVRYRTPVGPVRLDFGYNINPPTFPVFTTDSTTNITTFQSQTLKHFNVFFSIGQTF
jgi:outer membrane protein insertion porin family